MSKEIHALSLTEGDSTFCIAGTSMYPTLRVGWKIKVVPCKSNAIRPGDTVVFGKEQLICHRIIATLTVNGRYYFIHKGDSTYIGGILEEDDLVGKITEVFDDRNRNVDSKSWIKKYNRNIGFYVFSHLYVYMHIFRKYFWPRCNNKIIRFLNQMYWELLYKISHKRFS